MKLTIKRGVYLWGFFLAGWLFFVFAALLCGVTSDEVCRAGEGGSLYCVLVNNGEPE